MPNSPKMSPSSEGTTVMDNFSNGLKKQGQDREQSMTDTGYFKPPKVPKPAQPKAPQIRQSRGRG